MLSLKDKEPFGVGGRRMCYVHPENPDRCIKVLRVDDQRTRRFKKSVLIPSALRREHDNNEHERTELLKIEKRIGEAIRQHLPKCYGYQMTDVGRGLVLDLCRDHDGKISRSMRELFTLDYKPDQFRPAFDEFADFLLQHHVLTRNLHDHNIVAQHRADNTWRLYLIDGLGDPAFLPLAEWVKALGTKKIKKRIAAAWPRFEAFWKSGGVTEKMQKESTWDQGLLRHR
ncbi:MAG: YrbL family protein [Verrucomicrobiota bacterium]